MISPFRAGFRPAVLVPLLAALLGTPPLGASDRPSLDEASQIELRRVMTSWFDRLEAEGPRKGSGVSTLAANVLNGLSVGEKPERIGKCLDFLANAQISDPKNRFYGNFLWYWGDEEVKDGNGVEFTCRLLAAAWILHGDRMTPEVKRKLRAILELSVEGVRRQAVRPTYTNIYLMKIFNLFALARILDREDLGREARRMLAIWVNQTARFGVTEFSSPTYTAVDMENLALVVNLVEDRDAVTTARAALDVFWLEILAGWHLPSERMGGAHSRDYDRLTGHGTVDRWVARSGRLVPNDEAPRSPFDLVAWAPPSDRVIAAIPALPRTVVQSWGEDPAARAIQTLTPFHSFGTAEMNYWDMDKTPLVIHLGGGTKTPVINLFMDGRRDRYGKEKIMERSGHMKSLHLKPFLWSVQRGSEALVLQSVAATNELFTAIESILTLPADAEMRIGETPLRMDHRTTAWSTVPAVDGTNVRIEPVERGGRMFLRMVDESKKDGMGIQRDFPVRPGDAVSFHADLAEGRMFLYLNFYDDKGRLATKERIVETTGRTTNAAIAPAGAVKARAWLYSTTAATTRALLADVGVTSIRGSETNAVASFDFESNRIETNVLPVGADLFLRRGESACRLRVVDARNDRDEPIDAAIVNDGIEWGAFRLTATHATGDRGSGRFSLLATCEDGMASDEAFAAFRKRCAADVTESTRHGAVWTVRRKGGGDPMLLEVDLEKSARLARKGNEDEGFRPCLAVNGRDFGGDWLRASPLYRSNAEDASEWGETKILANALDSPILVPPSEMTLTGDAAREKWRGKDTLRIGTAADAGAIFRIRVEKKGRFRLEGDFHAPDAKSDSLLASVDEGPVWQWELADRGDGIFRDRLRDRNEPPSPERSRLVSFELTPGVHRVRVRRREAGLRILELRVVPEDEEFRPSK